MYVFLALLLAGIILYLDIKRTHNIRKKKKAEKEARKKNSPEFDRYIWKKEQSLSNPPALNKKDEWEETLIEWFDKNKVSRYWRIGDLQELAYLSFVVRGIPDLDFYDRKMISKLPDEICRLTGLVELILGSAYESDMMLCRLEQLPKCIGNLKNLKELHLQFNRISELPSGIGNLKKLVVLKAGGNNLRTLPKEIGDLTQLEMLTLWNNNITELPEEIVNLKSLKGIDLSGNPIEYNNKLTQSQKDWLFDLELDGCEVICDFFDDDEVRYKLESYDERFTGGYEPMTLEEIKEIDLNENKTYILYDGDGNEDEALTQKLFGKGTLSQETKSNILDKYNIEYLYHMTHIDNLESIIKNGLQSHGNSLTKQKIDNELVNQRRNSRDPLFNKKIHEYVPFYFNPKNPMLYVNKEIQDKIVILGYSKRLLFAKNVLFTDGNAAASSTKFYNNLEDLRYLNWECINAAYWNNIPDGKRLRMSEVLMPNSVDKSLLENIYCFNENMQNKIEQIKPFDTNIIVSSDYYF
jgi:hypothetical protein